MDMSLRPQQNRKARSPNNYKCADEQRVPAYQRLVVTFPARSSGGLGESDDRHDYYLQRLQRRMKSELALQFPPQPIDETILLDRSSICGGKRFCFVHVAVQTVKIGK